MEDATPTFCKELLSKKIKCNFSNACEKTTMTKPRGKYSCSNVKKHNVKEKSKFKKDSSKHRHRSEKFKVKDYSDISEIDDNKNMNKNGKKKINNIRCFMKKHKFKLRNDFDRKHAEQFLLSKEAAFEKPFLFFEEIVIEK